ncbi:MAG: hypothetical protein PHP89_00745 [Candidatus Omnitrophica bacterium]|jgi:hypothetical protein|nr:hypothetical protein [Candidatus Omnitrophota bacterium]MDD3987514.1 hypothetical protein [Candidatus Omnitrophota bacterium]MDD4981223.1 hypothetical protein [Candidatus Omnitrophota bacterium]MDD5664732.1 hypothetical protein [Candidatus Omnitrophota bacterium]
MILKLRKLLKQHKTTSLIELSNKLKVSLNKIKNISSGRTRVSSLFVNRSQHRVSPRHSKELAELIGIVLGDGNIYKFNRCQRLTISCNGSYKNYVKHVSYLARNIFKNSPSVIKRSKANCCDVTLYMQDIDKALGLPAGNKINNSVRIPEWILKKREYSKKCLKGLFETDGHYGLSKKNYVEYIQFCNECTSLKKSVFDALGFLKYSPQLGKNYVRLAKKIEVRKFIEEMDFVRPFPSLAN